MFSRIYLAQKIILVSLELRCDQQECTTAGALSQHLCGNIHYSVVNI